MTRRICTAALAVGLLSLGGVFAQDSVGQLYRLQAAPGHASQLEEGMKRHIGFHKANSDPWEWHIWSIVAGPYTGQYWAFTGNHTWSDFDNDPIPEDKDAADYEATMGPHVSAQNMELVTLSPEHSIIDPEAEFNLITVVEYRLAPDGQFAFMNALKQITDTLRAADKGFHHGTYVMRAGANGPKVYISFPADNWAGFESRMDEFAEAMTAAHGEEGFSKIMQSLTGAIRRMDSHVAQFRAELSSIPEGN